MYDLKSALLAAALSLPPPWYPPGANPETQEHYENRVARIAVAIAEEAEQAPGWSWGARPLAFAALTVMYKESHFALAVHSGEKLGDEGRAACLGQLHVSGLVPRHEWMELTGVDVAATRRCARATMRLLAVQHRGCRMRRQSPTIGNMSQIFAAYGSGGSCKPTSSSTARARTWYWLMEGGHGRATKLGSADRARSVRPQSGDRKRDPSACVLARFEHYSSSRAEIEPLS